MAEVAVVYCWYAMPCKRPGQRLCAVWPYRNNHLFASFARVLHSTKCICVYICFIPVPSYVRTCSRGHFDRTFDFLSLSRTSDRILLITIPILTKSSLKSNHWLLPLLLISHKRIEAKAEEGASRKKDHWVPATSNWSRYPCLLAIAGFYKSWS